MVKKNTADQQFKVGESHPTMKKKIIFQFIPTTWNLKLIGNEYIKSVQTT